MKEIFNKRQRFSIRKFSVGVASVLIGITWFQPSQQFFAATENALPPKVEVSSDKERFVPTNEKIENVATAPENWNSTESIQSTMPTNKLEKVETEEVNHTETSRNNGILIVETTTILKCKKIKR